MMRLATLVTFIAGCDGVTYDPGTWERVDTGTPTDTAIEDACGVGASSTFYGEIHVWNRGDAVRVEGQYLCAGSDIHARMCVAIGEHYEFKEVADNNVNVESGDPNYDFYLHYEGLQEILQANDEVATCIEVWDEKGFSYSLSFDMVGDFEDDITDDEDEFDYMGLCDC